MISINKESPSPVSSSPPSEMKLHSATPGDTVMDGDLAPSRTSNWQTFPPSSWTGWGARERLMKTNVDFTWGCGVCCVCACVFSCVTFLLCLYA